MTEGTPEHAAREVLESLLADLDQRRIDGTQTPLEEALLHLLRFTGFPRAFLTKARRLADLARKLQDGQADAESVRPRLLEGLAKLLADWPEVAGGAQVEPSIPSPPPMPEPSRAGDLESAFPVHDLTRIFLQGQVDRIQEFEVLCLEREKGVREATGRLLGLLHNLKGEYGVLDMRDWNALIHGLESSLQSESVTTDELLQVADLLGRQVSSLASGQSLAVPPEMIRRFLSEDPPGMAPSSPASFKSSPSPPSSTGTPVASPVPPVPAPTPAPAAPGSGSRSGSNGPASGSMAPWLQDPSFLVDFQNESLEHIRSIEIALLRLETTPDAEDALHSAFRAFHTIKGLAAFLKLHGIRKVAHAAESVLDMVRRRELELQSAHVDVLLVATDALRTAVTRIDAGNPSATTGGREHLVSEEAMHRLLHPETIDTRPAESSLPEMESPLGKILVSEGVATVEQVNEALSLQSHGDDRPLGEILVHDLHLKASDVGQALGQQARARQDGGSAMRDPESTFEGLAPVLEKKEGARDPGGAGVASPTGASTVEDSIRVPVDRLDQLIDAIGESVIAQSTVFADPRVASVQDLSLEKKMAQASMMLRHIQELSMSLRMVAIRQTFQKMSRLVRDLSRKQGKLVDLELEGETTELDKTVVENIGDPLVHMVRNSVDHGLEGPEERRSSGKSERGRVVLRAFHKAGSVHVEIEDDGRGLHRDRILAKAVAAGIVKPGQDLSDADVWRLIFHPGLSTAEKVTDISGRGVGMDVVKRNIESLRGSIDIRSVPGRGTCFTIRLPLTLAIIGGMVVRVGRERYIVPTLSVHTSLMPVADQISTVAGRGELLNLRGELLPLVRLHDLFGVSRSSSLQESVVMVVEDSMGRRTGLVVDEILDQQQVVVKTLGAGVDAAAMTGAAIMNDGTVSLILDVAGLVRLAREE
ncbi:MAG: chemotaxis protein CheA [Fibrobacteria bacterium]|nr:chemotaxis protein CheA [Fibrobacteria bacterium]